MGYLGNQITTVFPTSISVDTATIATANISNQLTDANMSAGSVVQVVSVIKDDYFSTSSTSFTDITGLTVSITPSSSSNKILILSTLNGSQDINANRSNCRLLRDSTAIMVGASAGNRLQGSLGFSSAHADLINTTHISFLDSPSTTSAITYKWQGIVNAGTGELYVNASENDNNASNQLRWASTITAMEIAG